MRVPLLGLLASQRLVCRRWTLVRRRAEEVVELHYDVGDEQVEVVSELLLEFGASSVDAQPAASEAPIYAEPGEPARVWRRALVRAITPKRLEERVAAQIEDVFPGLTPEVRALDTTKDWLRELEAMRPPLQIGRLRVVLPWHEESSGERPEEDLRIEGGSAFGTGEHATTRMCLEWLQGASLPCLASVMDYGAGSGILALAALKCGIAAEAVGVDVDPDCLAAAKRNAKTNGYDTSTEARFFFPAACDVVLPQPGHGGGVFPSSDGERLPPDLAARHFDVVIANILLNPLLDLAPTLAAFVRPAPNGGVLAVSGIRDTQFDTFKAAYDPFFASVAIADDQDGWLLVTCEERRPTTEDLHLGGGSGGQPDPPPPH
mmetsp:Transcript_8471/g.27755  ORF Transcript_8471/g.27755 Transcript_8471/m.27755 type:complete len:375 (-) Transcript_8471:111-1235(-)